MTPEELADIEARCDKAENDRSISAKEFAFLASRIIVGDVTALIAEVKRCQAVIAAVESEIASWSPFGGHARSLVRAALAGTTTERGE